MKLRSSRITLAGWIITESRHFRAKDRDNGLCNRESPQSTNKESELVCCASPDLDPTLTEVPVNCSLSTRARSKAKVVGRAHGSLCLVSHLVYCVNILSSSTRSTNLPISTLSCIVLSCLFLLFENLIVSCREEQHSSSKHGTRMSQSLQGVYLGYPFIFRSDPHKAELIMGHSLSLFNLQPIPVRSLISSFDHLRFNTTSGILSWITPCLSLTSNPSPDRSLISSFDHLRYNHNFSEFIMDHTLSLISSFDHLRYNHNFREFIMDHTLSLFNLQPIPVRSLISSFDHLRYNHNFRECIMDHTLSLFNLQPIPVRSLISSFDHLRYNHNFREFIMDHTLSLFNLQPIPVYLQSLISSFDHLRYNHNFREFIMDHTLSLFNLQPIPDRSLISSFDHLRYNHNFREFTLGHS
ncbi:hypothetical protein J6590_070952 [Homalodisca vitripennis]|nr:hypothetical protein J6590_070952 [Homalodisca vitripennis]